MARKKKEMHKKWEPKEEKGWLDLIAHWMNIFWHCKTIWASRMTIWN